ncbi:hypothetical protein [Alcanivorax sp.]|uniref:hypothetical protein n=1 Tax=Alcanivorax sp. TaxID=1872427 RepID=UPI003A8D5F4A
MIRAVLCRGILKYVALMVLLAGVARAESLLVGEAALADWGFRVSERVSYSAFYCNDGTEPETTTYQGIRSIAPDSALANRYRRFTLAREAYASEEQAARRLRDIQLPENRNSKQEKLCDMRKGFRQGSRVYFVHTDVSAFVSALPGLLEKLEQKVAER